MGLRTHTPTRPLPKRRTDTQDVLPQGPPDPPPLRRPPMRGTGGPDTITVTPSRGVLRPLVRRQSSYEVRPSSDTEGVGSLVSSTEPPLPTTPKTGFPVHPFPSPLSLSVHPRGVRVHPDTSRYGPHRLDPGSTSWNETLITPGRFRFRKSSDIVPV